jgi:acid phosphatase type 7
VTTRSVRALPFIAALLLGAVTLVACAAPTMPSGPTATPADATPRALVTVPVETPPPEAEVLLAVGDIASCGRDDDEAVAELVARTRGTVALLGDIAYPNGRERDFRECFEPAWGPLLDRLRPVPGNHDYDTRDAAPYFDWFDDRAGEPGRGWYAYDLGEWRIYALNSNCEEVDGCGPGSPQLAWLTEDLAANPRECVLAYWHHARFSSGRHGDSARMADAWAVLDDAGADVVLAGHDHTYERLAPLGPDGTPALDGIRSFVVGTGGRSLYDFGRPRPGTEARENAHFGVLRLDLSPGSYAWRFLPVTGGQLDPGTGTCR